MIRMFATLLVLFATTSAVLAQDEPKPQGMPGETKEHREQRMQWWREARFGMFIHWGIYSVPAGEYKGQQSKHIGEWLMHDMKIPVAEYAEYAKQFNPVKYDADAWVKLAKNAGMKYIVITSKHHDGFAMFDSKATDYDIVDRTPYAKDVLKPLAEACRANGMKLGFYYSQAQDWHHKGGAAAGGHWDKAAQDGDYDEYIKTVAVPQVKEILTNYGDVAVLWFDTPVDMNKERAEQFIPLLQLQPNIIVNNRLGGGFPGDTETPEQYIPATGFPGRDWETCMTMNDTWGFKSFDQNWKPTETLVRNLINAASKGGNYLLNVGPTSEGEIPQPSIERLQQIGQWMKTNGEAIYGTSAGPFKRYSFDGRCTVKGDRLYVHVFKWPADGVKIVGLKTPVTSGRFIDGGETASVTPSDDAKAPAIVIKPPGKIDPIATVVELQLDGKPEVDNSMFTVAPAADRVLHLRAADATVQGRAAQLENQDEPGGGNIGYWA